jgi:hypothetical protein
VPSGLFNPLASPFLLGPPLGLISLEVITPIAYLKNWALVGPIIASKFLLDFCLFLLEVIDISNLGPFPF